MKTDEESVTKLVLTEVSFRDHLILHETRISCLPKDDSRDADWDLVDGDFAHTENAKIVLTDSMFVDLSDECPICYSPLEDAHEDSDIEKNSILIHHTPCKHTFHTACLKAWLDTRNYGRRSNKCPY